MKSRGPFRLPKGPWDSVGGVLWGVVVFLLCTRLFFFVFTVVCVGFARRSFFSRADYRLKVGHPDTTCRIFDML